MTFQLSSSSLSKLNGVDERLILTVTLAIQRTKVDFGVICGLRTTEEQQALVEKGASKTMKSKHIDGKAVDLMAYIGSRPSWELNLYDDIGDAMISAAKEVDVPLRWGCAWHISDCREFNGTCEQMMNEYIDIRRAEDRRPFLDGPHWEIYE